MRSTKWAILAFAALGTSWIAGSVEPAAADPYLGKNLRGVARLAEGLDPISDEDVNWGIFKRAGDEKGEHVNTFYGAPFADNIAPGDYIVEVTYRQLKREFPQLTIVVNGGITTDAQVAELTAWLRTRFSGGPAWDDLEAEVAEARSGRSAE